MTKDELIDKFNLELHPEGGYYKETYRAHLKSNYAGFNGPRNVSTGIYYMLTKGSKSNLHRIKSDEMWHFYLGEPMTIVEFYDDGRYQEIVLGQDVLKGQLVQHTVPAGCWFGAFPNPNTEFSFVGCTVAPGFDFQDFEFANQQELLEKFPEQADIIKRLT